MQIKVLGQASQSEIIIKYTQLDLNKNLMSFLLEKKLPIASTCMGEGICRKCIINEDKLCCQFTLEEYISKIGNIISISYL